MQYSENGYLFQIYQNPQYIATYLQNIVQKYEEAGSFCSLTNLSEMKLIMGYSRYTCMCCFELTHCSCSATRQYSHQYTYVFLLGDLKKKTIQIYIHLYQRFWTVFKGNRPLPKHGSGIQK